MEVKAGDENSKFFQQFSRGRKAINTIWELENEDGTTASTFEQLTHKGITHFRNLYKDPQHSTLVEVIKVTSIFPKFVDHNTVVDLFEPITLEELKAVLKWLKKDKSPGPDGFSVEFLLAFFDLL